MPWAASAVGAFVLHDLPASFGLRCSEAAVVSFLKFLQHGADAAYVTAVTIYPWLECLLSRHCIARQDAVMIRAEFIGPRPPPLKRHETTGQQRGKQQCRQPEGQSQELIEAYFFAFFSE